jgi:xyloglucan:xyloglucosyl transferase
MAATGAAALVAVALMMVVIGWPAAAAAASSLDTSSPVPFQAGYMPLFGGDNLVRSPDGRSVRLKLDRRTGNKQDRSDAGRLLPFRFFFDAL